jgi:hypothetical protein
MKRISPFQIKMHSALKRLGYHKEPQFIPVFFFARSGSTVHGATLNSHSNCVSLNEAFENHTDSQGALYLKSMFRQKPEAIFSHYAHQRVPLDRQHFLTDIKNHPAYLRAQKGKHLTHCFFQFNHFYFPIFIDTLDFETMFSFIGANFPGMVFINRKNSLLKLVSTLRAQRLNVWHSHTLNDQSKLETPIYLNPNEPYATHLVQANNLFDYLSQLQDGERNILNWAKKHVPNLLELVYEEDIEPNVMMGVNKVSTFFNLPESATPLQVPIQKTSRGLKHDISNYDEICTLFKGTPLEWMTL